MKKFLAAALLLLISCSITAQLSVIDSVNIGRERWRDSLFRIDKSLIPTGVLTEYSLFPFDHAKYDGLNNNDDTVKTDGEIFSPLLVCRVSKCV